jgi:hypothetical protein
VGVQIGAGGGLEFGVIYNSILLGILDTDHGGLWRYFNGNQYREGGCGDLDDFRGGVLFGGHW